MSNEKMTSLLKRQEEERKDLAAGVFEKWQPIRENVERLLFPFGGQFYEAPDNIRQEIMNAREEFFDEWGSDGRLAALMAERHAAECRSVAEKEKKVQQIKDRLTRNPDHDQGR